MRLTYDNKFVLAHHKVTRYHTLVERREVGQSRLVCYLMTTKNVTFWGTMGECYVEAKRIEAYIERK